MHWDTFKQHSGRASDEGCKVGEVDNMFEGWVQSNCNLYDPASFLWQLDLSQEQPILLSACLKTFILLLAPYLPREVSNGNIFTPNDVFGGWAQGHWKQSKEHYSNHGDWWVGTCMHYIMTYIHMSWPSRHLSDNHCPVVEWPEGLDIS